MTCNIKPHSDQSRTCWYGKDLSNADLAGINFHCSDLSSTILLYASLKGANLQGADLQGADLRGADLKYADLGNANLRYADLRGADLQGADLTHSKINEYTWFSGTRITESQLLMLTLSGWQLTSRQMSDLIVIKD